MSDVNPYAAPADWDPNDSEAKSVAGLVDEGGRQIGAWRKGRILIMHRQASLPDRCVKTNQPTTPAERWTHTFSYCHWFVLLTILISPLVLIILYLICSKKATVVMGVCQARRARRRRALMGGWALTIGGLVGFFGFLFVFIPLLGAAEQHGGNPNPLFFCLAIGSLIAAIIGISWIVVGSAVLATTHIDKHYIWFKGVHRDYLAALPEWPGT